MSLLSGVSDLTALLYWWDFAYDISDTGGMWSAVSKRDPAVRLEEPSAEKLLAAIRHDYFGGRHG